MPSNEYETEDDETPPEHIEVENINGLDDLKNQLSDRGINVEVCVPEVLAMVHDFIDSYTIGAKIIKSAVKIQTWWRKLLKERSSYVWDDSLDPPNWGHRTNHPVSNLINLDDILDLDDVSLEFDSNDDLEFPLMQLKLKKFIKKENVFRN